MGIVEGRGGGGPVRWFKNNAEVRSLASPYEAIFKADVIWGTKEFHIQGCLEYGSRVPASEPSTTY